MDIKQLKKLINEQAIRSKLDKTINEGLQESKIKNNILEFEDNVLKEIAGIKKD